MPKRSADVLDYLLEPAELTDVAPERSMLYANILREIFLEAARTARDNPHEHEPIVVRRLLRGAARIEAWRSGSPVSAHRFPPPQISPAVSPEEPSPILGSDDEDDDCVLEFQALLRCPGCPGCSNPPNGCWQCLSAEQQEDRRLAERQQQQA